jgi:hypothetical protein
VSHIKWLSSCLVLSVLITALSSLFYHAGGEVVLRPGELAQVMLTGFILLVPTGDYYFGFPSGTDLVLNSIIYAGVSFGLVEMVRLSKVYR